MSLRDFSPRLEAKVRDTLPVDFPATVIHLVLEFVRVHAVSFFAGTSADVEFRLEDAQGLGAEVIVSVHDFWPQHRVLHWDESQDLLLVSGLSQVVGMVEGCVQQLDSDCYAVTHSGQVWHKNGSVFEMRPSTLPWGSAWVWTCIRKAVPPCVFEHGVAYRVNEQGVEAGKFRWIVNQPATCKARLEPGGNLLLCFGPGQEFYLALGWKEFGQLFGSACFVGRGADTHSFMVLEPRGPDLAPLLYLHQCRPVALPQIVLGDYRSPHCHECRRLNVNHLREALTEPGSEGAECATPFVTTAPSSRSMFTTFLFKLVILCAGIEITCELGRRYVRNWR